MFMGLRLYKRPKGGHFDVMAQLGGCSQVVTADLKTVRSFIGLGKSN